MQADDNINWLGLLKELTLAEKNWHEYKLPDTAIPNNVKNVLESSQIGRYVWDTSDLTNENYWNTPIKSWSKAKTIHFENRNDSIMFKLLWS